MVVQLSSHASQESRAEDWPKRAPFVDEKRFLRGWAKSSQSCTNCKFMLALLFNFAKKAVLAFAYSQLILITFLLSFLSVETSSFIEHSFIFTGFCDTTSHHILCCTHLMLFFISASSQLHIGTNNQPSTECLN